MKFPEATSERELQKQIVEILRLKGIVANVSRMDKRKTDKVGWPDITFAVWNNKFDEYGGSFRYPCAWEIKFGKGKLSPEQTALSNRMSTSPNAWNYRIIRSVDEAIFELGAMGL